MFFFSITRDFFSGSEAAGEKTLLLFVITFDFSWFCVSITIFLTSENRFRAPSHRRQILYGKPSFSLMEILKTSDALSLIFFLSPPMPKILVQWS